MHTKIWEGAASVERLQNATSASEWKNNHFADQVKHGYITHSSSQTVFFHHKSHIMHKKYLRIQGHYADGVVIESHGQEA